MATTSTTRDLQTTSGDSASLIVSLPTLPHEALEALLGNLSSAFQGVSLVAATPEGLPPQWEDDSLHKLVTYKPAAASTSTWTLTAADFVNAHELRTQYNASAVLLLGPEAQSLSPEALRALSAEVLSKEVDLAVPRYSLPTRSSLVSSSILYPTSRALFGASPRFPLAIDLCMSARMAERLATVAQRFTAVNQADSLIWPVAEAAVANFNIDQVEVGSRVLPQAAAPDLNTLLAHVTGSLFSEIEAKAAFWQRNRVAPADKPLASVPAPAAAGSDEVGPMLEAFRLAYGNLAEIWSLVLPPQSLLGLKRLSVTPAETFAMPDSLWARIVYDFLLAYRLRTINRGHLLGALTPLYLAWVASHIRRTSGGADPEGQIESLAAAFAADKPYLVSRWRWPDRFNP